MLAHRQGGRPKRGHHAGPRWARHSREQREGGEEGRREGGRSGECNEGRQVEDGAMPRVGVESPAGSCSGPSGTALPIRDRGPAFGSGAQRCSQPLSPSAHGRHRSAVVRPHGTTRAGGLIGSWRF